jgi:hypothetical protein
MSVLKDRLFLVAALVAIIAGVVSVTFGGEEDFTFLIFGMVTLIFGIILLISGYLTPTVAQSKTGRGLAVFLLLASVLVFVGSIAIALEIWSVGPMAYIAGFAMTVFIFFAWPCICCQGSKGVRSQVIGVASAHDSISMAELSRVTGVDEKHAREIVYDAIGKRQLDGRMKEDTFVRSESAAPTHTGLSSTSREREVVKVLVICPFCGAKTEQGLSKCQNCGADL